MNGIPFNMTHKIGGGLSPKEMKKLDFMDENWKRKGSPIPQQKTGGTSIFVDPETGRSGSHEVAPTPFLKLKGFDYDAAREYFSKK